MVQIRANAKSAIVPTIPYRDTAAMVDWLSDAFGFQKQHVAKGENGEIKHARLAFGDSTIMVFPVEDLASERLVVHPDQVGGVETQTCYLVVSDIDAHYARAKAKGADIIFGIRSGNYGGRGYASRDPEGHVWMFGTYDPQQGQSLAAKDATTRSAGKRAYVLMVLALFALTLSSAATAYWTYSAMQGSSLGLVSRQNDPQSVGPDSIESLLQERAARLAAESELRKLRATLSEVRNAKETAERKIAELVARESTAQGTADQTGKEARQLLARANKDRDTLTEAVKHAEDQLKQLRIDKQAAEAAAKDASDQLEQLRLAKVAAEQLAKQAPQNCERDKARFAKEIMDRLAGERSARAAAEVAANELRNQLAALGTNPVHRINELRLQIEAKERAQDKAEIELKDARLQLAQEKHTRDASERALRQTEKKLAAAGSCWACPTGAPCERPE